MASVQPNLQDLADNLERGIGPSDSKGKKMKVVFQGNETADVSEIQSVFVNTTAKRIEVCVKHKTEKTGKQKVSYLADPRLSYSRRHLPESAKKIVKELESLSKAPDMPIQRVVKLTAWRNGHLQVEMDTDSHVSARGLALLCWDWPFDQNPSDEELKFRTGFRDTDIKMVASTDIYKQSIEDLMREAYNTAEEFKWWLRDYGRNMPRKFGKRMRLSEDATTELINSIAEQYGIDLGDLKGSSALFESERTIGSGRQSVYLYYYQWDRERAKSKGQSVWECKIGKAERPLQERLREQATDPEKFKLGLHIQTDNPVGIEGIIHDELKKRGKHIGESLRTEWFLTSPSEVEEIYNFIGESSHESTLDG